ncbi:hypothetical protein [Kamptonema formosum]|nr:hypothetical protein [Oscillatoria sp. PCC 10802]
MENVNNQNFTSIPDRLLVEMLAYGAVLAGIKVILTEEYYRSRCRFVEL